MTINKNERVMIVAPLGNDARSMAELINAHGFQVEVYTNLQECCEQIKTGAGTLLFTEETLGMPDIPRLFSLLQAQPAWSEIPLIILTSAGKSGLVRLLDMTAKAAGSVTILERPIGIDTLLRSVEVAMRSRRRQYQIRDLIEEQKQLSHQLEQRVQERTQQLEEQAEQLRNLAVELTEFEEGERKRLAQMLHDHLQQLLVAVKIRLQLLERRSSSIDKHAITEVQSLLEQAYDSSRSLTAELRPPVLYESGLIAALHFLARKFETQHKMTVHLSISEAAEPGSSIFKTIIYHSIQELLFNAVKYAGVNECFLKLERFNNKILITLRDEGIGFDPAAIGKKGTGGFGLFSIRERMKALGAEFNITSGFGKGTIFEMSIPDLVAIPEVQTHGSSNSKNKRRVDRKGFLTVLIADDHKIVRQSLAQVLVMQPFIDEVLEAEDGRDAILKVEENNPDVVIMDLNMPRMNGLEATRLLYKINPHLKIIGLSVQSEEETAQAMKKAGAIEYFNKNTDTSILVETLKHLSKLDF